jgi:methylated-DNA-protein-cysteine methyltransferase related protein
VKRVASSYEKIWDLVRRIPRGRVATYGQLAALAGLGRNARLAGYALHALPAGSPLPWHRVLAAGGRLSLVKLDAGTALTQRLRLEREGVEFDARGRVRMERHAWRRGATNATSIALRAGARRRTR